MNIYISGRMTGLPDYNYPAFFRAEERLRQMGHNPINPARVNWLPGMTYDEIIATDLAIIATTADALYMLPQWFLSMGAMQEHSLAVRLGLLLIYNDNQL